MNIKSSLLKALLFTAVLSAAGSARANTFAYTNGSVMICFRKSPSGTTDLIVNAGPISYYTNLAPNTTVPVPGYTGAQLGPVGTNNLAWSAWTYFDTTATPGLTNTIYMSNPRPDLTTLTTPYYRDTASAQLSTISKLASITAGAVNNANFSVLNSPTAVLLSESYNLNNSAVSYYLGLGSTLDFKQTFQAQPEQYTPANFTTGGTPVRADFYWLKPTANNDHSGPPATFLGYFQLSTNGVMTYTAYPSAVVVPATITSITRTGTTNVITFTTGSSGTYTLCGSSDLTAPRAGWPALSSVAGNGSPLSLTHVTSGAGMFYLISAQ
jgi:hypothetical protein